MPEIILDQISKLFDNGKVTAVANISLTIHDGEYAFILGPSGCGKTTLLRMISGLTTPTSGHIRINGKDVTNDSPQIRGIAFVFQHFEIFPISVWENCTYALKVQGFPDDYIIQQGQSALKVVGLQDQADQIPNNWGNGDLQRLGIARAICSGAKILIMDEPLGSLDPKIGTEFRWELRNIIKDNHLTAIQVTHNQEEAMNIGDRIIIMRNGQVLQQDEPEHLYNFPNSIFVGNFLGGLNILEGYIRHIDGNDTYNVKIRLGGPHFIVKTYTNQPERFYLDENVVVAFRFEDVYLFPLSYDYTKYQDEWIGLNSFECEVKDSYLTGKELYFIIEMDTGDKIQVHKPEVFQYHFVKGEKIRVGVFTEEIRIFKYPVNLAKELDLQ
jgi:ABC-type Fe3+/spermidine/putrescine transport system ATPase subunit